MARLTSILKRLRSWLFTTLAVACIVAAVLVGLARLVMPMVSRYQPEFESWLSERVGQPVEIAALRGRWSARGPVVALDDMQVIDPASGDPALRIASAEVYFDVVDWLLPGQRPNRFRVLGGEWHIQRLADGQVRIEGLGAQGGAAPGTQGGLGLLFRQGTIELSNTRVRFSDATTDTQYSLNGVDLVLNNTGDRHLLQVQLPSPNDAAGSIEFRLEAFGNPSEGQIDRVHTYLLAEQVDLAAWAGHLSLGGVQVLQGRLDAELWGELYEGRLAELNGDLALRDLIAEGAAADLGINLEQDQDRDQDRDQDATVADPLQGQVRPRYALEEVVTRLNWQGRPDGWQLGLSDLQVSRHAQQWPTGDWLLRADYPADYPTGAKPGSEPLSVQMGAEFVRIQDLANLVALTDQLPAALRQALLNGAPSGELKNLQLAISLPVAGDPQVGAEPPAPQFSGRMEFDDLSLISTAGLPGFSALSGTLASDGVDTRVSLASDGVLLRVPQVFKQTLPPVSLRGDLYLRQQGSLADWLVVAPEFSLSGAGFNAQSRLRLELSERGPFVDATIDVRDGDLPTATRFLPTAQWDANLVNWLQSALVHGRVTSAATIIRGNLKDWPFAGGEGTFRTRINAEDGIFEFSPDWPALQGMDATIDVVGNELRVLGRGGTLLDAELIEGQAVIPNLRKTILSIAGRARGDVSAFREVIRSSPLEGFLAQYFADIDLQGQGDLDLGLRIPMTGEERTISVDGEIALSDSTVRHAAWNSPFDNVQGGIVFSERGFTSRDLNATMNGQPVAVELEVGPEFAPTGLTMMAYISGEFEPREILVDYPTLMPVAAVAQGRSKWTALLTAPEETDSSGRKRTHMTLTSDLVGTSVALPAPLGKPAEEVLPLTLSIAFPFQGGDVQLIYGDRGSARARATTDGQITAGILYFGDGMAPEMPEQGIRLEGRLPQLDGAGWVAMAGLVGDGEDSPHADLLHSMDLQVDQLAILGRQFDDARLQLSRDAQHWNADIEADGLLGQVRLPASPTASQTVVAEFAELRWPSLDEETESDQDSGPTLLDPRTLPSLHLFVEQLELYGVDLGVARLQTYPTADGLHVETLEANSERMQLRAKGDWRMEADGPVSEFAINLISESLGNMLSSMGFADAVDGGQTIASLTASWPGAPVDFKLSQVTGEMSVSVSNGRIPEAEVGAGRILGLLSLNAIPRRLALDFSDLFETGMGFDVIEGSFQLGDGQARTEDLSIRGPAMDITVSGRAGLIDKDYDQVMVVVPKVGVTFPIVGALAAGPGGAAAGFLLSNIFSSAIDDMSQFQYTVTGSWDDPVIELRGAVPAGGSAPTGS